MNREKGLCLRCNEWPGVLKVTDTSMNITAYICDLCRHELRYSLSVELGPNLADKSDAQRD